MARLENELLNYESKYEKDNVLINKLGITDPILFEKAEREITGFKIARLYINPGKQTFDVNHYLSIHKYIFDDIYSFAGEIRDENIAKRTPFCPPQHICENLELTLANAKKMMRYLDTIDKLIDYVPVLYSDLNAIHPFREGNGRCGREFIRQYIKFVCKLNNLGPYEVDFGAVDKTEFIEAVIKADTTDITPLKEMFKEMIVAKTR